MNKQTISLLADLHVNNHRQGPGSDKALKQALQFSGINKSASLKIADIGCGTGSSSIALAKLTNASIVAVDFVKEFLEKLEKKASFENLQNRIKTINADMSKLPFEEEEEFDIIWSEGAIYNVGFLNGIKTWRKFLKPQGVLVITEITWLVSEIPLELKRHWEAEYPEISLASKKMQQLESNGYKPIGYFILPKDCWINEYYQPLEAGFSDFLKRNKQSEQAKAIVESERKEIALYKKYQEYYSYGCYIAEKIF